VPNVWVDESRTKGIEQASGKTLQTLWKSWLKIRYSTNYGRVNGSKDKQAKVNGV